MILGGLILAIIGGQLFSETEADEEVPENVTEVNLLTPSELEKNTTSLVAYGTAGATQDTDLYFEMSGIVEEVYIHPGAYVEEDMVLAKLESEAMDAAVAQAEAAYDAVYYSYRSIAESVGFYDFAQAEAALEMAEIQLEAMYEAQEEAEDADWEDIDDLDDIGDLLGSFMAPSDVEIEIQELVVDQYNYAIRMLEQSPSEESLDAQWAYVEQAQAALDSAYAAYDSIYLRAPFEGEVTTVDLEEYDMVMAGVSIGKLVNRENIEAVCYLSSEDADSISVGNNVMIDDEYEGYVLGISSRVDEYTGKRKIRVQMDGLGELTSGDTVSLEIEQDTTSGVTLVPITALLFDDEDAYIYFYYDGAVYKRLIDAGDVLGNYVEILNMPHTNIVEDVAGLRSGQEVSLTL